MSVKGTIESLLTLAVAVKHAYKEAAAADKSGSLDWSAFLESPAFAAIESDVERLADKLSASNLDLAIDAVRAKETALLAGQPVARLPPDKLLQYADMIDLEQALVKRRVASIAPTAAALAWLVDDLLSVLVRAARIVIPV
jgi:hypothetical protein